MLGKVEELRLIGECVLLDKRESFGRLVEEYQDGLRSFLLNLTSGNVMLSEDLAQESFIKAYLNLRHFKGISRFKTWLYRIAYNQYISYVNGRHSHADLEAASVITVKDSSVRVDSEIDIARCLRALSDMERTVITLFYLQDVEIKDISKIIRVKENTVKSHLLRGRNKLKLMLENNGYEK
ncbi:MAG: RNA polymerase sigma factor [Muribaculaceae bacterium]|nr:RNA polymerase sigma factor [Muribaculaceae bacterium]